MAGERIGKTYEAILKVVLSELRTEGIISDNIFWNETPDGIHVEPDFLIGDSINNPQSLFLVTHIGSAKDSEKKCWRNIGELCEAKPFFGNRLLAYSIIFDSIMKQALKEMQGMAFDYQLVVGDTQYGKKLQQWVINNEKNLPIPQEEKAQAILFQSQKDPYLRQLLDCFKTDVITLISEKSPRTELNALWESERSRSHGNLAKAKDTYLRRGFTKRLLVGDALTEEHIKSQDGPWLERLGLAKKTINGYKVCDDELSWFLNTEWNQAYKEIAEPYKTSQFDDQIKKVRCFSLLEIYQGYILDNYDELITTEGMKNCLVRQYRDPISDIIIPTEVDSPKNIWIYDIIASAAKACAGKSQAFGYAIFATHPDANKSLIGNMNVGEWCSCFINQYFTRKKDTVIPEEAVSYVAKVLAEQLSMIGKASFKKYANDILQEYIDKEYGVTLLSHRGFDPLIALLAYKGIISPGARQDSFKTCFAEKANLTGKGGTASAVRVKHTLICVKSAYGGHPADKKKELAGRAVGLRYTWNNDTQTFLPRENVEKLILLLDGNWKQPHLDSLIHAGWDEIYYPDEIDKLKAAIV